MCGPFMLQVQARDPHHKQSEFLLPLASASDLPPHSENPPPLPDLGALPSTASFLPWFIRMASACGSPLSWNRPCSFTPLCLCTCCPCVWNTLPNWSTQHPASKVQRCGSQAPPFSRTPTGLCAGIPEPPKQQALSPVPERHPGNLG